MTNITRKKRRGTRSTDAADAAARTSGEITRDVLPLELRAQIAPASWNAETRTLEVTWSTGARVRRNPWFEEPFDEELSMKEGEVRLDRLNKAAPVLRDHYGATGAVIGVVERAWIESGQGRALVRFSAGADVKPIVDKIAERVITQVSIGYRVFKWEDVTVDPKGVRILRAVDWQPHEISFVAVGADAGASARADTLSTNSCTIVRRQPAKSDEENMAVKNSKNEKTAKRSGKSPAKKTAVRTGTTSEGDADADDEADGDAEEDERSNEGDDEADDEGDDEERADGDVDEEDDSAQANRAKLLERKRVNGIVRSARASNVPIAFAEKLIRSGTSLEIARDKITDEWARLNAGHEIDNRGNRIDVLTDERQTLRRGIEEAILFRHNPSIYKLEETSPGREFVGMSLREIARESLEKVGIKTRGMSVNTIAETALSVRSAQGYSGTTDFALTLENIINKILRRAYEAAPQTWRPITKTGTLPDFKTASRVNFGGAPSLLQVGPSGEIETGNINEAAEKYQLLTYARIFAVNRQAIINDDLGAFTRLPELFGTSARNLESDLVWKVITANAAMADGFNLFSSQHANSDTPVLAVAGLNKGRSALRLQTGLNGQLININPRYLIVPAVLETLAQQLTMAITPTQPSSVNPFVGLLQPIPEPRLDATSTTAWYMAGDTGQVDILEASWLEGVMGPRVETRIGFEVEGVQVKAVLDFGVKAIDWRGIWYSNGTV